MKEIGLLFALMFSFVVAMTVITYRNKNSCNMNVTLDDGTTFKARRINWYKSETVDIIKCSDERVQFPSRCIKNVKINNKLIKWQ